MVIDASALVSLLENEDSAPVLRVAVGADLVRLISTVSVLEATCVLSARRGPLALFEMEAFLSEFHFQQISFDVEQLIVSQKAWLVYGRGRHAARLNFGDCASYALAQTRNEPLLFIGNDFSKTDVPVVQLAGPESGA
jgi:ribonuclease VapC